MARPRLPVYSTGVGGPDWQNICDVDEKFTEQSEAENKTCRTKTDTKVEHVQNLEDKKLQANICSLFHGNGAFEIGCLSRFLPPDEC